MWIYTEKWDGYIILYVIYNTIVLFLFICFLKTVPNYISTNSEQGFCSVCILNQNISLSFLSKDILTKMWRDTSLWIWFSFPWRLVILSTCSCRFWLSVYILQKNVYLGPLKTTLEKNEYARIHRLQSIVLPTTSTTNNHTPLYLQK